MAEEVTIVPWNTESPKGCAIPEVMNPIEAKLYEKVRTVHCDRKNASHECSGRVTLDRNGMTLQCPLCGDTRTVYRRPEAPHPPAVSAREARR